MLRLAPLGFSSHFGFSVSRIIKFNFCVCTDAWSPYYTLVYTVDLHEVGLHEVESRWYNRQEGTLDLACSFWRSKIKI